VRILYVEPKEERLSWNRRETEAPAASPLPESLPPHTADGPRED
jgi:hypothetical protein